jgi:hypothetical protein
MTGLPIDESFVVVADAEGYLPRRVFVESLYQQQDVYLLPESQVYVEKIYELSDYTGLFPSSETVLKIQRGINGSWQTVQGDLFGATGGFEAQLRSNTRHRLVLLNTVTGERRILGRVTPISSGAEEIEVHSRSDISLSRIGPVVSVEPQVRSLEAADGQSVTISVDPLSANVTSWNYTVTLVNESGQYILNQSQQTEPGSVSPTLALDNQSDGRVTVSFGWETSDGRSNVRTEEYSIVAQYDNRFSLLSGLNRVPNSLSGPDAGAATTMIALLFSLFGAAAVSTTFQASTEGVGLVALGGLAIFSVVGWVPYGVVFAVTVAWVALVAVRRGL